MERLIKNQLGQWSLVKTVDPDREKLHNLLGGIDDKTNANNPHKEYFENSIKKEGKNLKPHDIDFIRRSGAYPTSDTHAQHQKMANKGWQFLGHKDLENLSEDNPLRGFQSNYYYRRPVKSGYEYSGFVNHNHTGEFDTATPSFDLENVHNQMHPAVYQQHFEETVAPAIKEALKDHLTALDKPAPIKTPKKDMN